LPSGDGLLHRLLERATLFRDVLLKLFAEELDHAPGEPGRGITQGAEGAAVDVVADVEQQVDVARLGIAGFELVEEIRHPEGPLPARRAFPAAFVVKEL